MGLEQISFLAADVDASSDAFNRRPGLPQASDDDGSPAPAAAERRARSTNSTAVVETTIRRYAARPSGSGASPRIPTGLRRLVRYYRAHLGQGTFVAPPCNAPWASLFIEADGAVRPCFFHPAVGNLRERSLAELLSDAMPAFRAGLDVATNPMCTRCVCSLNVGLRSKLW